VLALSNGSQKNTQSLLKESGLDDFIDKIISIDDIRA